MLKRALASLLATAGCTQLASSPGGRLQIRNQTEEQHTVYYQLTKQESDKIVLEETKTIKAGENHTIEDAYRGGVYAVTARLDNNEEKSTEFDVGGCSDLTFYIVVDDSSMNFDHSACE